MSQSISNMLHPGNHVDNHEGTNMEHLRNNSSGSLITESVRESRVLVLYTGGTIGMIRNENGGNALLFLLYVELGLEQDWGWN